MSNSYQQRHSLSQVAARMFRRGFSQIPVKERATMRFCGVVTDHSILRLMLSTKGGASLKEYSESPIGDLGVTEDFCLLPPDEPLVEAARMLMDRSAVLLESRGEVTGIVTRADFLKLLYPEE